MRGVRDEEDIVEKGRGGGGRETPVAMEGDDGEDSTVNEKRTTSEPGRLNVVKCYEIMFGRLNGHRQRNRASSIGDDDDDENDGDDESADFLKAYCDNRNSFVFDVV